MPRIARSISWLVGHTPLVELARALPQGGGARVVAKLEGHNPTGSNKDRAVLAMIQQAARGGTLKAGGTIVEATAGDVGTALAVFARDLGYRVVLVMPETHAGSRCNLLRTLGAEIVFTDPKGGMSAAQIRAEQIARQTPGATVLQPFTNRANAAAHQQTAREIWEDTEGEVAGVVCPVGTGGTAAGCVAFFRATAAAVAVIGVEPARCAVLGGGAPGPHDLPGLGAGFVPDILCPGDLARVVAVDDDEAIAMVRHLAHCEALLVGPASGAVVAAAARLAREPHWAGKLLVAVLPDQGERYEEHPAYASAAGSAS